MVQIALSRRVATVTLGATLAACSSVTRSPISNTGEPLLYVEVTDSIGLPLPDARIELYTRADAGLFREWVAIEPAALSEGIHLLRFSHPGYRPSVFSVPVRTGGRVSVRVRLMPDSTVTAKRRTIVARSVRANGIAIHGKETTDIVGNRRVLDREALDAADGLPVSLLLREARETGLVVEDSPDGLHSVRQLDGWTARCAVQVILNGDATLILTFARFEELYRFAEPEAVEVIPRSTTLPFYFRRSDNKCAFLMVWLSGRQL